MSNKVTTQWFDAQVKHGNYQPLDKEKTLREEQQEAQEKHEQENKLQNVLDKKEMEEIGEMEDDLDFDDQFMREYMAKRRLEIKDNAKNNKYGKLIEISKDEYVREVTNADPESFVVIHLYQTSSQFCQLINMNLPKYAEKYANIKFVKIVASKCIENFPDSRCPCIIIYKAGKPVSNITNVDKVMRGDINNFQNFLESQGVIKQE